MNPFDHVIIAYLNRLAGRSYTVDTLVWHLGTNYVLKTGLITALLYWTWFGRSEHGNDRERRATLVFGLAASCAAVVLARVLSLVLPFRERPLRAPELHFVLPESVSRHAILGWSSFPSDNATLFFGVALAIFLVSRRAGILAFCNGLVAVAFARVYLGYHYPTDILGGAALGMGAVALGLMPRVKSAVTAAPMRWLDRNPQAFQTALCVLVFFIGTTFEPFYPLVHAALDSGALAIDEYGAAVVSWGALLLVGPLAVVIGWVIVRRLRPPLAPRTPER